MRFDFDHVIDRRGTSCVKWDAADRTYKGTDLLPMWIADMDFPAAPAILEHLHQRVDQQVFGYGILPPAYYQAVINWMSRRHHCEVRREWIVYNPGVVSALNYAVQAATQPGDEVLVNTPVYGPFYHAVEDSGRVLVKSPLKEDHLYYTFDFEDMERRVTNRTRALILCSPHNPVGRVWKLDELQQLADFCLRHDLIVIADEIHHDLVYQKHTVLLNVSPELAQRTILCTAPSKTFNLAGIQASNIIIPNEELRQKYRELVVRAHAHSAHSFVAAAVIGAYDHSEAWLDQLIEYLEENMNFFCAGIEKELPQLRVRKPEGTYLAWVDCSELGLEKDELKRFMVEKCGLALSDGAGFGEEGARFARFNLACPRSTVAECLRRLKSGIDSIVR